MATFIWSLQGSTPTTIDATDIVEFAGSGGFGSKITVASFNDTTHVRSSANANDSSANTPHNNKFLTSTTVSLNGAGSTSLSAASTAACALKINFSDASSVATSLAKFFSYDGTTIATAPANITFKAAQQGNSTWVDAEGQGTPVNLADQTASTSHDFFILISASPDTVGLKTAFALRIELTYS